MAEEEQTNSDLAGEKNSGKSGKGKFSPFLWLVVIVVGIFLLLRHFGAAVLWNFFLAVSVLGVVVIVHEFGHFIAAKLSGMRVEAFSFGFPPTILGIKRTRDGHRIRILPMFFRRREQVSPSEENGDAQEDAETEDESQGDGLIFTFGKVKNPGETEYRISLIPFGGYVKIFGQEDIGRIKYSNNPRSYTNQPVWKRVCVISAGVIFNAILAVILSVIVFSVGIKLIPPIVGGVAAGTPASRAGLKGGDEIVEVAGHSYNLEFADVGMWVALADEGQAVNLKVRHEDSSIEDYKIVTQEYDRGMGPVRELGIILPLTLKVARLTSKEDEERLYSETGLRPGNVIKAVNGIAMDKQWQMERIISDLFEPTVTLTTERVIKAQDGSSKKEVVETEIDLGLNVLPSANKENDLGNIYSIEPCLKVGSVTLERDNGLVKGDIIIAADVVEYPDFNQLRKIVESNEGKEIALKVLRADLNGVVRPVDVRVVPVRREKMVMIGFVPTYALDICRVAKTTNILFRKKETAALEIPSGSVITAVNGKAVSSFYDFAREMRNNVNSDVRIEWQGSDGNAGEAVFGSELWANVVPVESIPLIGIQFEQMKKLYRAEGIFDAVKMGYKKAVNNIVMGYTTMVQAIRRQVSPRNFMGPVGILTFSYQVVTESSKLYYLYMIALISALIGAFNTIPILPFDGGHIVFLIVEEIKGSPVSRRIQESFSTAGFLLLLILAAYITFNDVVRTIRFF
jgi:regulator of sigma E protease